MGYDITFHPVRLDIEGALLRDVMLGKRSTDGIAKTLPSCNADLAKHVEDNLRRFVVEDQETNLYLASHASYCLGMLAGYFRPFWYTRGQALSFMIEETKPDFQIFTPFLDWLGDPFFGRTDPSFGSICSNWTGAGVIVEPKRFLDWFERYNGATFDEEGRESVCRCLKYSVLHDCQMLEVADVYSPMAGSCTNPDNARAHFLNNVHRE